ncbi:hypothetical protein EJ08DRAFT_584063 [Tothia fuscella]|uniref:Uncharacterized protein n=1 Tax=Tothia fuscella TaxID=1048955 RepID=A0A9P4U1E4_9PEZI|nr:hypothetical protein EJ08DRAFT_584063 [Tothia fuscella]
MRGFVSEPNCGRGTIGIIWSCLLTIFLCTYTATHLDVSIRESSSGRKRLYQKAITVGVGIMAPETIAWRALQEFRVARLLKNRLSSAGWTGTTLTQAYFLYMGGIVLSDSAGTTKNIVGDRLLDEVLRSKQCRNFREQFPPTSEIMDKSKSDFLGKCVTLVQILWFSAQVIMRHIQGSAVSLL